MTTDTRPKQAVGRAPASRSAGMAKGSGMIHPNLATMLAVVTTDYPLEPGEALEFLQPAVADSFNSISVDGECSTNDAVVLLANGASGAERDDDAFVQALAAVCNSLAAQIVADGEGATYVAEVAVAGAASEAEAKAIASRIATSPLVKTALHGRDANWGRILAAAGSAPFNGGYAQLDPTRTTLTMNGVPVFAAGSPQSAEPTLDGERCRIELELGLGAGRATLPRPPTSPTSTCPSTRTTGREQDRGQVRRRRRLRGGRVDRGARVDRRRGLCRARRRAADLRRDAPLPRADPLRRRAAGHEPRGAHARPRALAAVNAASAPRSGRTPSACWATRSGSRRRTCPSSAWSATRSRAAPPAVTDALEAGPIPVVAPLAAGPLNVNADEAAAALAVGLGAERLLFVTDVPGLLVDGAVVAVDRGRRRRPPARGRHAARAGIVPKLRAAVTAARLGVRAEIGETAVVG